MKVGLYARVSTDDQECEQQLTALRDYVAARGWTIQAEYVDQAVSGTKDSRPAFNRIMAAAGLRKVDVVVVWKLDRWGRSIQHLLNTVQQLESMGVRFIAITQNVDTDAGGATGKLLLHILGAFAEFERSLIVERVNAGLARARKAGKIGGRRLKVFNRQKALDMRAAGSSLSQIAEACGVSVATIGRVCQKHNTSVGDQQ